MSNDNKKIKKIVAMTTAVAGGTFVALKIIKNMKRGYSAFLNEPEQKNPMNGKKVIFVRDDNEPENADGVKGHLEAVGEAEYTQGFYERYVKRAIDVALSFGGLILLSPVYAVISFAIIINDPGPVIFTQKRIGKNKEYFKLHKFRSMKMSTPHDTPTHMLDHPEEYITKVGKFLRAHSLDELPQIWDIFIGNMSVIGPRPGLWNQDVLIAERDKYGANNVKPGLTGWAQINGRDKLEIQSKAKLDGEYCSKMGFVMDAKCFFGSVGVFGKDDSVVEGGTGELKKEIAEKKKILVICQYYKPEPFRISDICEMLAKRGHEVTVVTGTPNYPMGEIYKGYENDAKEDEVINGVNVHRCKIIPRKTGTFHRFLNYYSYPFQSSKYINKIGEFDVVFINQLSPVMMAKAGIKYAKKHNVKSILYCLDLWPESLVAGGINRTSLIYKFFHVESAKIYKNVDQILATSRSFKDYFENEFAIKNVDYLPQYAENLFNPMECEKQDDEYIDLMFAGNVGTAQSLKTVIEVARKCIDVKNLRWHIVGDGVELENIKRLSQGLPIVFYGRKQVEEMPKYYAMADAMLVTMQKDSILSLTLPGKVQSYMAAGKPIVGAIDGETQRIIVESECGFAVNAEDTVELEKAVRKFAMSDTDKVTMGKNSRKFYEENFEEKLFIDKLEKNFC